MTWKQEALVHAKDQAPKESVGLLLNIKGKEKVICHKTITQCRKCTLVLH